MTCDFGVAGTAFCIFLPTRKNLRERWESQTFKKKQLEPSGSGCYITPSFRIFLNDLGQFPNVPMGWIRLGPAMEVRICKLQCQNAQSFLQALLVKRRGQNQIKLWQYIGTAAHTLVYTHTHTPCVHIHVSLVLQANHVGGLFSCLSILEIS